VSNILRARFGRTFLTACSLTALTIGTVPAAFAQSSGGPSAQPAATTTDENTVIVIGDRSIIASLRNVAVEQTYDEQGVNSYGVSTIGELLDEIRNENGDADPALLINGQPVADGDNISDLPVEAIARVDTLPRGSAQRVNGAAGQRVYNIVLRKNVKSATVTVGHDHASEGGWWNNKGEALLTYVDGQDRINVTVRGAKSDALFESERDFIPRTETTPYSAAGNIIPAFGTEVDPLLSALVGQLVSVVALPAGNAAPTLASLTTGANRTNPSDTREFRSLRGASRPIEFAVAGAKVLTPWLTLQVNGRLNWNENENFNGLPSARFLIPATNPFSPFSGPVSIALNDPARALTSNSDTRALSLSSALNATLGEWRGALAARWDNRRQDYRSELTGSLGGLGTVGPATNPFDGSLAALIPVTVRKSESTNRLGQVNGDAEGPLFGAWAGSVRGRVGASASWVDFDATDTSGARSFNRHEYLAKAGVTIPLSSREEGFLPMLGDSSLALDFAKVGLGRYGTLSRRAISFEWQIFHWLRGIASAIRDERAIVAELLAAPEVTTANVPYFDPLTGQTIDVTIIYGGAEALDNEGIRTRSLSLTANPWRKYNLQIDASYSDDALRDQIGALPLPSAAVVAAFPDRFQRDAAGTLILVDNRSVNFARQDNERLRLGIRFAIPLSPAVAPSAGRPRVLPLRLQVNAAHILLLNSTTVIRDGLPEIDLLDGGAIGIGGGLQRHTTNASLALTKGVTGVRLEARRRGESRLVIGTPDAPDLLTFNPLTTIDLKAFVDLGQLFPKTRMAKATKITLSADNLANQRQRVTNRAGDTPQAYQPVRRDPIGRVLKVELRKIF
jgi:hypothetical protein